MSLSIEKIANAQVHIGTLKSEAHPKTNKYWLDVVQGMVVFNPEAIIKQLDTAKKRIQAAKKDWKNVLIACEKKMYAEELEKLADQAGVTFLNYKIPAGFLTNFDTFQKRVASMNQMIEYIGSDEFKSLTKKEQLIYKRKLSKIEKVYKGTKKVNTKPDLVVVIDGQRMSSFVDEIKKSHVDNIIIASSDFSRWRDEDSIVMANVGSYKSLDFVLRYILS